MGEHETRFMHARQSVQERLVAWLDDFVNGVAQEARALVEPRLSERFNQFQAAQETARQTDELSAWNEKASAAWAAHQQQYAAVLQAAPQMAAPMASGAPPTQMMAAPTTPGGIAPETPGGSAPETSGVEIAETEMPDEEDVEEDGEEGAAAATSTRRSSQKSSPSSPSRRRRGRDGDAPPAELPKALRARAAPAAGDLARGAGLHHADPGAAGRGEQEDQTGRGADARHPRRWPRRRPALPPPRARSGA